MSKALIIGGGVAGPVAALALQRAGVDCMVYEAHTRGSDDVGSYLTVASNGVAALRVIDADHLVTSNGFATSATVLESGTGKRLARLALGSSKPHAPGTYTIKRSRLYSALRDEAFRRGIAFEFNKRLVGTDVLAGGGVSARFADGATARGDMLIGADGVHSATRSIIDPAAPTPRYVGLINFGGYSRGAPRGIEPGVWYMTFGRRVFFGYVVDPSGNTVWFVNVPHAEIPRAARSSHNAEEWRQRLIELVSEDRTPAAELVRSGRLELVADNTYDLGFVPVWHRGPMVIIGDAAHAPSPSSGQGASLAIEDGLVLAQCLRDNPRIESALEAYEDARRERVEKVVAHGARMSSNKTPGPIGRMLRDLALPLLLKLFAQEKSQRWLFDYRVDDQRSIADA